jgi:hypothetical protein
MSSFCIISILHSKFELQAGAFLCLLVCLMFDSMFVGWGCGDGLVGLASCGLLRTLASHTCATGSICIPCAYTPWLSVVLAAGTVFRVWMLSGVTLRLHGWLLLGMVHTWQENPLTHTNTRAAQNGSSRITAVNPGTTTYNASSNAAVLIKGRQHAA